MFLISNWALIVLIRDNWFKNNSFHLTSNPVPIISVILFLLSISLALEMVYVIFIKNRKQLVLFKSCQQA